MSDLKQGFKAGANVAPTFGFMFLGYGLSASVAAMPEWAALCLTLLVFAAPAQFAIADVSAQGGGAFQMIFIAVVVNLRFFVMSLTLAGTFDRERRWSHLAWCQFVSATTYLTTFFNWRGREGGDPFRFYQGVVMAALPAALAGTAVGLWLGAGPPALLAFAATLFLPVYFSLMLAGERLSRAELSAVVMGFVFTPLVEVVLPGWGLFLVAMTVGLGLYRLSEEDGGDD
jgi:predicted branched-subunit amino acid permease